MNDYKRRQRTRHNRFSEAGDHRHRTRCFRCWRPQNICHCDAIPRIENATEIIIAQHIRERSHPFNTARMVHQALERSRLFWDYPESIHRYSDQIDEETCLLYPSPQAKNICDLAPTNRPSKLLILDGTWNQVKQLYRNWPQLSKLEHYQLEPDQPGNYRIRREPNERALSTVEATLLALQHLEPGTLHLDKLMSAFGTMVDRQLAHPAADYSNPTSPRKQNSNIPSIIKAPDTNFVFAYGEAEPINTGSPKKATRLPVYWVAQRSCGRRMKVALQSSNQLPQDLLNYFQLPKSEFANPVSIVQFNDQWRKFINPNDVLIVYNHNAVRMLQSTGAVVNHAIPIRSINYSPDCTSPSLNQFFAKNQVVPHPAEFPGRPGRRLANLITLISHLRNR